MALPLATEFIGNRHRFPRLRFPLVVIVSTRPDARAPPRRASWSRSATRHRHRDFPAAAPRAGAHVVWMYALVVLVRMLSLGVSLRFAPGRAFALRVEPRCASLAPDGLQPLTRALHNERAAAATCAPADPATAPFPRAPPRFRRSRRASRRPRIVAVTGSRGHSVQSAMHALRYLPPAAATVAPAVPATPSPLPLPARIFRSRRASRHPRLVAATGSRGTTIQARNACIAQLTPAGRRRRARRTSHPFAVAPARAIYSKPPRVPAPATRRGHRHARALRPERNARIALPTPGGRHRRVRRTGHPFAVASAFANFSQRPREPPPATCRGYRLARNCYPGRNACIAQLTPAARHRRVRRDFHTQCLAIVVAILLPLWCVHFLTAFHFRCCSSSCPQHRQSVPENPRTGAGYPHFHRPPRFIR
ncbi:hypothetical protein C7S15_8941 (plasmid) [Burkholderia cepacia]|nr:hypothetical protein [Burkholderia cepacia]